jgi:predicted transcriptional regulator
MNWKTIAKRTNSLPPGWSSPDEIAAELDCEINEVPKILSVAMKEGLVERQNFPHYQEGSRQLLYVTGYRQIKAGSKPAQVSVSQEHDEITSAIMRAVARHSDKPIHRIIAYLPNRIRSGLSVSQVRALIEKHRNSK